MGSKIRLLSLLLGKEMVCENCVGDKSSWEGVIQREKGKTFGALSLFPPLSLSFVRSSVGSFCLSHLKIARKENRHGGDEVLKFTDAI